MGHITYRWDRNLGNYRADRDPFIYDSIYILNKVRKSLFRFLSLMKFVSEIFESFGKSIHEEELLYSFIILKRLYFSRDGLHVLSPAK